MIYIIIGVILLIAAASISINGVSLQQYLENMPIHPDWDDKDC